MNLIVNHRHVCPCGTVLLCVGEPDKCAVLTASWQCPTCDLHDLDTFIELLADTHSHRNSTPHKEN